MSRGRKETQSPANSGRPETERVGAAAEALFASSPCLTRVLQEAAVRVGRDEWVPLPSYGRRLVQDAAGPAGTTRGRL